MKNCLDCKIYDECAFGEALEKLREFSESDDGIGTVVKLTIENIEKYVDCSYYE